MKFSNGTARRFQKNFDSIECTKNGKNISSIKFQSSRAELRITLTESRTAIVKLKGETPKLRTATAKFKAALAEFQTELPEQIAEMIEFQAQFYELKGASAKQKAVIELSLSQTITAIYTDFGYFAGVEAGLAAVVCWKRSPNWSATGLRPGVVLAADFTYS